MVVHHFSAASLCPISARMVNGAGPLLGRGRMVCHAWLVETKKGLVLVDTGVGTADLADVRGRLGRWFGWVVAPQADTTAIGEIRKLGFDPREVRHIVPTHLDLDHAGGIPDFPWAEVHVFRPEYEAAMKPPTTRERHRYRPAHFAHRPRWNVREPGGERWRGFEGVRAIDGCDDLLLIPLVGHTRGHCGVAARTADGWLLHAGDAYFFHQEMSPQPRCTPGLALFQRLVAVDNAQRLANQARLRELALGGEVRIMSAHCPVELERAQAQVAPVAPRVAAAL